MLEIKKKWFIFYKKKQNINITIILYNKTKINVKKYYYYLITDCINKDNI